MDIRSYFDDLRSTEAQLVKAHPKNEVFVTSKFYRERNSTEGTTISASCRNAARVITDGTHREATKEEIEAFYGRQKAQLEETTRSEQLKRREYVVVVDPSKLQPASSLPDAPTMSLAEATGESRSPKK